MQGAPLFNDIARGPEGGRGLWVSAEDGVRLRLGHWAASASAGTAAKGTVLLFPGRTEYIEKYGLMAGELAARGYDTLTIDWRGQGLADRLADDAMLGHVERFSDYQRDVRAMVAAARGLDLPQPFFLLAHSMGGCIGLRALHEGLPVAASVFSGPMWGIAIAPVSRVFATLSARLAVALGHGTRYAPTTGPKTYVLDARFEDNQLTTDREMWDYMVAQARAHPDLTLGGPSMRWFHEALAETADLVRTPPPGGPAHCFLGGDERIVDPAPVHRVMGRWTGARFETVPGAQHEIMMEGPETRAAFLAATDALFAARA